MKQPLTSKLISTGSLLVFFLLSIPYLTADPDINLCCYTDAFRMEGLSTIQLRNYINLGYLSFTEGDMMIKQPLFNLILFLPLKLLGTHLFIARLTVLLVSLTVIFLFERLTDMKYIAPLLCFALLGQYHLFQYSHYSMPDLPAIGMILFSLAFIVNAALQPKRRRSFILLASLFSVLAFSMKQLYMDVLLLVPISLLVFRFIPSAAISWSNILHSILWIILFSLVYFLLWYLPNATFYNHVTIRQTAMRFDWKDDLMHTVWRNIRSSLLLPESRIFMLLCFITFLLGVWEWFRTDDSKFRMAFIVAALFMLLEMHKVTYAYFPPRYQAGIFFSVGLLSIIVVHQFLFALPGVNRNKKAFAYFLLFAFITNNIVQYYGMYGRRQYAIREMNEYMKSTVQDPRKSMLGSWAPAITWESKSRSIPVVYDLMNDKNTLRTFRPVAGIITESRDSQSIKVFTRQGIDLNAITDSTKRFTIGLANCNLYWLSDEY